MFTAEELSEETGVSLERIRSLVTIGLIERREPERFTPGDGFRAKMIDALIKAGVSFAAIENAVESRALALGHVDRYVIVEPGRRSERSVAEFIADLGSRGVLVPSLYQTLGIPAPAEDAHLPIAEERLIGSFLEAWRLAPDDDALRRAARLVAEGTRLAVTGWADLFDEQVWSAPERLLHGEDEVSQGVARVFHLIPPLVEWLTDRYIQQILVSGIVENLESYLASRGLAPEPPSGPPPAVAFVDLSGFTSMTEQLGDATAARTSEALRERADAVAEAEGGRVIKVLGDGVMMLFRDPAGAVRAAGRLVVDLKDQLDVPAHAGIHAGPVVQRDRDVFGRTVNLASRLAGQAGPGEVVVSEEVAALVRPGEVDFQEMGFVTLKGVEEPVRLLRLTPARGGPGQTSA
jgi:adenylate cyclase